MTKPLSLHEKVLLLALQDQKGTIDWSKAGLNGATNRNACGDGK